MSGVEYHYRHRRIRQNCIDVMSVLNEEGPCTRKELGRLCHMGVASVRTATKRLERDDRIVSFSDPADGRRTLYMAVGE